MNLAILKIGARIVPNGDKASASNGEALSIIKLLINCGFNIDVYTKVLSKDEKPIGFNIYDINSNFNDIQNHDALIVINGNVNFFGGAEAADEIAIYKAINNFKNNIYYILCDPALVLKQIWKSINKKDWGIKYNEKDIVIDNKDINVITQCLDVNKIDSMFKEQGIKSNSIYFPFEKFPLYLLKDKKINSNYKYDILYGGTFRSGKRELDMIKFYFNYPSDINVEIFGKIKADNFNEIKTKGLLFPKFDKAVSYNEFYNKMSEGLSTVIIGDKLYKDVNDLAQRIYESIRIGNIVFIDESYDKNKRVFSNKFLRDICYVDNKCDIINKIRYIKSKPVLREEIINLQREDTKLDIKEYENNLTQLIR